MPGAGSEINVREEGVPLLQGLHILLVQRTVVSDSVFRLQA